MPFLIWPALAGATGLFVGSSMGGFMRSVVKLAALAGAAYFAYLIMGK